jgi:hypothetical protein
MSHRHSSITSVVFAYLIAFASVGVAQHAGHGASGPGTSSAPPMQGEHMTRNVNSMLANAEAMLRGMSAGQMQMAGGEHDQVLTGMKGMLDQMQGMSSNLTVMLNDPMLMQQGDAKKALNQASRDLEKMAAAFQSMTKNMRHAMTGQR